jgi:PAS domain S-box-containing protein
LSKTANDVRAKAAAELVGSDELIRLLLDSTGEGIYGVDLEGNCTFANPACARLLGFEDTAELLGKQMHELVHHTRPNGEPYPVEECRIYQAFREHRGTHVDDEVMFCSDGKPFPAEYWSYPVERHGELVGCVVTFLDISERRRVEEELRQTDELVRLLLDSTGEGIYGVDLEGNCTFANPACARLLGFQSTAELLGKQMHELVHHTRPNGEPYPVEECRIYKAFREHQGTHVDDEVMFCSDGKPFPAEYWSYPLERDGELVGCVVTFVDISERRRVEEELRQTEKMAALGKLSAGLAHELNNPAAAAGRAAGQLVAGLEELQSATVELARAGIGPNLWDSLTNRVREFLHRTDGPLGLSPLEASDREEELLSWLDAHGVEKGWDIASTLVRAAVQSEDLEAIAAAVPGDTLGAAIDWLDKSLDVHELAGTVARSTRSISDLVGVVKSYSYMDQAPQQYVNLHTGIEDTITILGHKLKQGIEVVRQYDRDLPQVQVKGSELNQVWTNLIDNAIGAMDGQGTITVRTFREGDDLAVEIADDGPGIPEEIQPRIFDPFFTTKDVGEGTGLGLDVARRIVTARCGGHIDFRSRPGGTVFRVRIPLDRACDAEEAE